MSLDVALKVSGELNRCRDTARGALGDQFESTMAAFAQFVKERSEPGESMLAAATRIGRMGVLSGMETVLMLAAVVESIESGKD